MGLDIGTDNVLKVLELAPGPKWLNQMAARKPLGSYDSYFLHKLQARYIELEADLRTMGVFISKQDSLQRIEGQHNPIQYEIVYLLMLAKEGLENETPNLIGVSSILDLISRYKIWADNPALNIAQAELVAEKLKLIDSREAKGIADKIEIVIKKNDSTNSQILRPILDEAIAWINRDEINVEINNGLQIQRLKLFRTWGFVLVFGFTLLSPIISNFNVVKGWPFEFLIKWNQYSFGVVNIIGIVLIGAAGGFFSGILQVRATRTTLQDFRENMLKLQLKPIIGSFLAIIVFVILSWQVLPAIKIDNVGSFIFIAFVCGFSERYFLKLLELKSEYEPVNTNYELPKSLSVANYESTKTEETGEKR